jgi:hypothetical protein
MSANMSLRKEAKIASKLQQVILFYFFITDVFYKLTSQKMFFY